MVIGLLAIAAIPTTIGVSEALSAQKKQDAAAKEKAKFNLTAIICVDGGPPVEAMCVLGAGKLYIDHPERPVPGHKFTGYYFTYPSEEKHLGLVSTIADDPPMLNWIFVDKDTGLFRHGSRTDTVGHVVGPWRWTDDEQWLTLRGEDAKFIAVLDELHGVWQLGYAGAGGQEDGGRDDGDDDDEEEDEEEQEEPSGRLAGHSDDDGVVGMGARRKMRVWVPIRLRRRLQLGMESRYVKGGDKK